MVIVALNSSIDDESYNRYHSTALLELMHISKSKNILFHTDSAYIFGFKSRELALKRKAAMASTPTMDITNTGNNWKLHTATTLKSMTLEFEMVNFTMKVILRKVM